MQGFTLVKQHLLHPAVVGGDFHCSRMQRLNPAACSHRQALHASVNDLHLQRTSLKEAKRSSFLPWKPLRVKGDRNGRGILGVKASLYENVLPAAQRDNTNPYPGSDAFLDSATSTAGNSLSPPISEEGSKWVNRVEGFVERAIFNCRFLTLMAIGGSLAGSILCFFKGCTYVQESFVEYFYASWRGSGTGKVILLLIEAVDVYLMGTVMLIFGMGLYELFISSLDISGENCFNSGSRTITCDSNFFGLFQLRERPKWLEIHSLDELKTKLGHVIVMILLVGMFEKSKKVQIHSATDLLCFSASVLLSSGCLFFLSKLHSTT